MGLDGVDSERKEPCMTPHSGLGTWLDGDTIYSVGDSEGGSAQEEMLS